MSKLFVPGGTIDVPPAEEAEEVEGGEEAIESLIKEWMTSEAEVDGVMLDWSAIVEQNAPNEAVAEIGEFARAFAAARIMRHQLQEGQPPLFVEVAVQIKTTWSEDGNKILEPPRASVPEG